MDGLTGEDPPGYVSSAVPRKRPVQLRLAFAKRFRGNAPGTALDGAAQPFRSWRVMLSGL